ncbi:2-oxoglutarate dehydrogenase [Aquisphaera insulae]|uniref:2-oxoglutarate dehydrogenase n=1 Tax=Aquisphaera insulae TaxID=2712864 RepID=UPI0013ED6094|nr:2-oxoglutarate dehydrogenase [Aquisphaera insulae]
MIYQLVLPGPIEGVDDFCVLEWHRDEAQDVAAGGLIVELETQKTIIQLRAAAPVVLRRIGCRAGEWRRLGEPIGLLSDAADEPLPEGMPADLPILELEFDVE